MLLDSRLGDGFAALILAAQAESLTWPAIWDRLGVRRVRLLPPEAAAGPDDLALVHPPTGFLAETGQIVLLRPDRYVAAVIPLDRLAAQSAQLEALAAATFG